MELKNLSHRTESLVHILTNKLIKEGKWIEGSPWVKISQKILAKALKCTAECVSLHVRKLKKEGVLFVKQLNANTHDHTNFYSINPMVLEDEKFTVFFNRSITKKICDIYNINKSFFNKSTINQIETEYKKIRTRKAAVNRIPLLHNSSAEIQKSIENESIKRFSNEEQVVYNSMKPTIVQDMVKIWEEEIHEKVKLTKPIARYLVASFKQKFGSSLEKWRSYVIGLKNSTYISKLRKLWKSILNWALSFKVIDRIFAGGFGVTMGEILNVRQEENEPEEIDEAPECLEIRKKLQKKLGNSEYRCWLSRISLEETGKKLRFVNDKSKNEILVKGDRFNVDWVLNNYLNIYFDDRYHFISEEEILEKGA